jgi:hypothetical protein
MFNFKLGDFVRIDEAEPKVGGLIGVVWGLEIRRTSHGERKFASIKVDGRNPRLVGVAESQLSYA